MANINITSDAWTEISITSGTVQNISATADIELSAEQTDNSGVVLKPSEIYQWDNETIYARAVTESAGALRVVNFKKAAGGGGGYVLPVASASTLGGVKVGSGLSIDGDGVLSSVGTVSYSTTEQVIGTWIDGKPLYQISYNTNIIIDGTEHNIADCPANIDYIVDIDGTFKFISGADTGFVHINTFYDAFYTVSVDVWQNKIRCNGKGWDGTHPATITLQYTKTTD